jgi:hypothetical protein
VSVSAGENAAVQNHGSLCGTSVVTEETKPGGFILLRCLLQDTVPLHPSHSIDSGIDFLALPATLLRTPLGFPQIGLLA